MNCLFCNIISGDIPATTVYEDANLIGIEDIHPQAPTHIVFIPKKHIRTINELEESDTLLIGQLVQAAKHVAAAKGFAEDGFRLVFNVNAMGGQTVFHIHLHLLGQRPLQWPPG